MTCTDGTLQLTFSKCKRQTATEAAIQSKKLTEPHWHWGLALSLDHTYTLTE